MDAGEGRWRLGTHADVAWITDEVTGGLSITAAIPPRFAAYATLAFALGPREDTRSDEDRFDDAVVRVLTEHTPCQPWWLGYLDTGASDVVMPDAPRATAYWGWGYVLLQAGPREARTARRGPRWHTALPELIFPADRSWLLSSLWDDAWACVGGPDSLVTALLADRDLGGRAARTDPSVADMWPAVLPDWMHERLSR